MSESSNDRVVMSADVVGSTRLYEQFGDTIARADMAKCIEMLADTADEFSGVTLKTIGDEIMVGFEEAIKAALAATEMQANLRTSGEEGAFQMGILHIKIGWHYGKVAWRGEEKHPTTKGLVCAKSLFLPKVVHSKDRLKYPMLKKKTTTTIHANRF